MKAHPASHFISRELSWLEFNQRVLSESLNHENPLLERVKFFCIVSSNLDEFFEVRVAGLKQQIESDVIERSVDGRKLPRIARTREGHDVPAVPVLAGGSGAEPSEEQYPFFAPR